MIMLPDNYEPKPIPKGFGIENIDIIDAWNRVTEEFGIYDLSYPLITFDPNLDLHFGISHNGRMVINVYAIPKNIPRDKYTWWIEYGVINHEIGHYHICPYNAAEIYNYLLIINSIVPNIGNRAKFGIVNYFSDLIVDSWLSDYYPDDYPKSQLYWYKWNDLLIKEKKLTHTTLWKIMVKTMELKWGSAAFDFDDHITKYAERIRTILDSERAWSRKLSEITDLLKEFFKSEMDLSESIGMKKGFAKRIGNVFAPFDLAAIKGDPYDKKYRSNVSQQSPIKEKESALQSVFEKYGSDSFGGLKQLGLVKNITEANRLWFRYMAKKRVKYEVKRHGGLSKERDGVTEWHWGDRVADLNIVKSISVNPLYPFPPYARKYAYRKVKLGETDRDYYDVIIVIDSSSSMKGLSIGKLKTPFDYAALSALSVLHAAYDKQVKFAVINFSSGIISTGWLSPTYGNLEYAERTVMKFMGNTTIFPTSKIIREISQNQRSIIIAITDGKISNWKDVIKFIESTQTKIYLFSIRGKKHYGDDIERKISVFHIEGISDLPKVVTAESAKIWG